MGKRSHGLKGFYEAYGEMVVSSDQKTIPKYLDYVAAKKLKTRRPCPFGSNKRASICHLGHVVAHRKQIPRGIAEKALERLKITIDLVKKLAAMKSLQAETVAKEKEGSMQGEGNEAVLQGT